MQLKISHGQDESKIATKVNALIDSGWKLDEEQMSVQKTYYFKTYTKVMVCLQVFGIVAIFIAAYGTIANTPLKRTFITLSEYEASPRTITQK